MTRKLLGFLRSLGSFASNLSQSLNLQKEALIVENIDWGQTIQSLISNISLRSVISD